MSDLAQGSCGGIVIHGSASAIAAVDLAEILAHFSCEDLRVHIDSHKTIEGQAPRFQMQLKAALTEQWAPGLNTLDLARTLQLDTIGDAQHLVREVVIALLMAPIAHEFPSVQELVSAVRIRCNVVRAARKTSLAFQTSTAERPSDCWVYDEEEGFVIRPDASLITALIRATQPEVSGTLFSFSCYRASEYILLLGIAQELKHCNLPLYDALESYWRQRSIKSGAFHEVFLREQGSMESPLPPYFFVPGDRVWFRNPDEASADAAGFEGSWVMYLGGGLFSNFWKHVQPYTLEAKCLEIYHWRDGLYRDDDNEERIDESKVALLVEKSRQDPDAVARILQLMERYREPRGVYTEAGGCLDTTREFARWVCPGTSDLLLPSH